eukprot:5940701-Amphidinium_carterae.1
MPSLPGHPFSTHFVNVLLFVLASLRLLIVTGAKQASSEETASANQCTKGCVDTVELRDERVVVLSLCLPSKS